MKLAIRFAGICTHFCSGTAGGVPHRVVLPNATEFTTGLLSVEAATSEPVAYYLLPHFAQLEVAGVAVDVPPLVEGGAPAVANGDILTGIRLQILNAVEPEMIYTGGPTRRLTEFMPDYALSSDVVLHGRAACYFDFYGGTVSALTVPGGATQTSIELTTKGPPELLVTPLVPAGRPARSFRLLLDSNGDTEVALTVKNLEVAREKRARDQQEGVFDFLLHYLTARGGIPQSIRKCTPGMNPNRLVSATPQELEQALDGLAAALQPNVGGRATRTLVDIGEVTPSCSDSQYP